MLFRSEGSPFIVKSNRIDETTNYETAKLHLGKLVRKPTQLSLWKPEIMAEKGGTNSISILTVIPFLPLSFPLFALLNISLACSERSGDPKSYPRSPLVSVLQ